MRVLISHRGGTFSSFFQEKKKSTKGGKKQRGRVRMKKIRKKAHWRGIAVEDEEGSGEEVAPRPF